MQKEIRVFQTLEEEFEDLFENSPDMSIIAAIDTDQEMELRIVRINQTFLRVTGYTKEELMGQHLKSVYPEDPESLSKHMLYLSQFLTTGEIHSVDRKLKRKNLSPLDVTLSVTAIRDHSGRIRYGRTVWRDVSRLKEIENALKRANDELELRVKERTRALSSSEDRYRNLFESAMDAMLVFDEHGQIQLANRQAEKTFCCDEKDLRNQKIQSLIPKFWFSKGAYGPRIQTIALNKKGVQFPVELSLSHGQTSEGIQFTAIIRDTTDAHQFEKSMAAKNRELIRSNGELEKFAYVTSHDLREPLRTVTNYAQLLQRRYSGQLDSEADKFLGFMTESVQRMQQLISDLLAYSRVGRADGANQFINLNEVLKTVKRTLNVAITESGANIQSEKLPSLYGNPILMEQLFQNLLSNAIKFRKPDLTPLIYISVESSRNNYIFAIKDNGIGIAAHHSSRIFVIFQRLHNRAQYDGTGIGLAICKKILELVGGSIWMKSVEGEGTVFYFSHPQQNRG